MIYIESFYDYYPGHARCWNVHIIINKLVLIFAGPVPGKGLCRLQVLSPKTSVKKGSAAVEVHMLAYIVPTSLA